MTTEYSRSVLRIVVAQICQTIGWHSINSTPLEFMVDLMQEYFLRVSKLTHQYAEVLGRTEANLDDLGLAFQHMNIDVHELAEYIKNVDSVACPLAVPKFPIRRENHLNFLKPGSREVVTRPVHVHEHLPAMYPDTEEEYVPEKSENITNGTTDVTSNNGTSTSSSMSVSPHRVSPQVVFKRPGDPVSFESPIAKRAKVLEEGRPLREIHSVMMTTSGFLSPAREGKLPESRTPQQARSDSPQPSSYPMVPPELKCDKKPRKIIKKGLLDDRKLDKENKKKNRAKELFRPDKLDESKVKKLTGMKELAKLKPLKPGGGKAATLATLAGPSVGRPSTPKIVSPKSSNSPKPPKNVQAKVKTEKVTIDLTSNSPPSSSSSSSSSSSMEKKEETIDKLPSEPDKQKLNIFKKISKPREDKDKDKETTGSGDPHKYKELNSRESSPGLIIDENVDRMNAHRNNNVDSLDVKREDKKMTAATAAMTTTAATTTTLTTTTTTTTTTTSTPTPTSMPHTPDVHPQPDGAATGTDLLDAQSPSSDVYMFDDLSPPGTPSTPKTPELNVPAPVDQKKKRREKSNKRKEPKLKSPKHSALSPKKTKLSNETIEPDVPDRPKTPQAPEPPAHREPNLPPPPLPFPFFPTFPPAPGLIPHQMFSRFPLPFGRGGTAGPHPAMPNLPLPPRFLNPVAGQKASEDGVTTSKTKSLDHDKTLASPSSVDVVTLKSEKLEKEKAAAATGPDKAGKKSKEHKKEKKDKLKKKKDKKEKHKEKGDKVKEKKERSEKRDKLEKMKEKKEKKDKRKEKDKEDKSAATAESVPKITLKLGPSSPRPPTPDNAPMKKITIKTLLKKPEEDSKREPSPELAKISALVTRPPKQKSASKKTEDGMLDAVAAAAAAAAAGSGSGSGSTLPPDASFSANLSTTSFATIPRAKKSLFKALPQRELSSPSRYDFPSNIPSPLPTQQQPPFYFDEGGRQVWICPACGKQDDGQLAMVGCDDCDAWYHWVCVGMQVPPADNENWYCRFCIAKTQELHHDKKKKKRKKKVKVAA